MERTIVTFILIIFNLLPTFAAGNTYFYHVNSKLGFSMRQIASLCKDKYGFVWASSKSGVLRLSESQYNSYPLPYINTNFITSRLLMQADTLWCYTTNGQLFRYNELYDRFELEADICSMMGQKDIYMSEFIATSQGSIWIPTKIGIYRYLNHELLKVDADSLKTQALYEKADGNILVVHSEGISEIDTRKLTISNLYQKNNSILETASALYYDDKLQKLWIGTLSEGLYTFDLRSKKIVQSPLGDIRKPILTIKRIDKNNLLLGIDGAGVIRIDLNLNKVVERMSEDVNNPTSLRGNGVYDILYDPQTERVWVSTYGGGISYYYLKSRGVNYLTHQVNNANSLINNNVNKILEDSKGDLWFATDNGLSRLRKETHQWDTYYNNYKSNALNFLSLAEDKEGHIWAGTYSEGFFVLDRATGRELEHHKLDRDNRKMGKYIYEIIRDTEGDMWVGGLADLVRCQTNHHTAQRYNNQPVRALCQLGEDTMVVACTYCTFLIDKNTGKRRYICDTYTQDVEVVGKNIWMATNGRGLLRFNTETRRIDTLDIRHGLLSNFVNSILYADSSLWLGTENGLCRYKIEQGKEKIYSYQFTPELAGVSFNTSASLQLRDGTLLFGTSNGAIKINVDKMIQRQNKGKIYVSDIIVSGTSIRQNDDLLRHTNLNDLTELSLSYNQNVLSFDLIPLHVEDSEVHFRWKLEGVDKSWTQPTNHPQIQYSNLPVGKFILHIFMIDSTLEKVIDERSIVLNVHPALWNTWWFRIGITILFLAGIAFVVHFYYGKLKQKHTEEKISFFTRMAHEMRTSLTLITAPLEELGRRQEFSGKGGYFYDLASQQVQKLNKVVTHLLDFEKLDVGHGQLLLGDEVDMVSLINQRKIMFLPVAQKKGIDINFTSQVAQLPMLVDEIKIEKVIDNLLSNAVKYSTEGSKIEVSLSCTTDQKCLITVRDYGIGISKADLCKLFHEYYRGDNATNSKVIGSGIGLIIVKKYVEMHQGSIGVESTEGQGTTFSITLPVLSPDIQPQHTEVSPTTATIITEQPAETAFDISLNENTVQKDNAPTNQGCILIVEDNEEMRAFLEKVFEDNYQILLAADGVEGCELLSQNEPDLIISDVMMPRMNGLEFCRKVKSDFATSHIPLILLSAFCEREQQLQGMGCGADEYMAKPFDTTMLMMHVEAILKNRQAVMAKLIHQKHNRPIVENTINNEFVQKAKEVIVRHMSDIDFNKDKFSAELNISGSLLYKKLKSITGISPTDFIRDIRMEEAYKLLQKHRYTVSEVSNHCGYATTNYFSSVFKKKFGISPSEV